MSNLHSKIMNLPVSSLIEGWTSEERHNYKLGHRDARHAAAELATAHDEVLAEVVEALRVSRELVQADRDALHECSTGPGGVDPLAVDSLAEYDGALAATDAALSKAAALLRGGEEVGNG